MPPLVLPSGLKPCRGKKRNRFHASGSHDNVTFYCIYFAMRNTNILCEKLFQFAVWSMPSNLKQALRVNCAEKFSG